jgi:hypothetical protein
MVSALLANTFWDSVIQGAIIGGIVGGIGGGVAALVYVLAKGRAKCSECGEPMPRVRKPANRQQMLWGGWTCPECGAELDRRGNLIKPKKTKRKRREE